MDMFVVRGGRPLTGTTRINGAKNAALPIMAASLMAEGPVVLRDVPDLIDVSTLCRLLETLGVETRRDDGGKLRLQVIDEAPVIADYELVRRMRASICVLGPLLAKRGHACVSLPGGCNIGDRPIDLHLKGLEALGADIRIEHGYVIAQAAKLRGARIFLGGSFGSTVTGTCNVLAAAVLAEGVTSIESAACEPEVIDFGMFLNSMGAKIEGLGTPFLTIEGVDSLTGCEHSIVPDRIEAATLLMAAAMTQGDVTLENVCIAHLTAVLDRIRQTGLSIDLHEAGDGTDRDSIRISNSHRLQPAEIAALPYPGVPTDVQAQFMALLSLSDGISVVTDKVFPDRFMHVPELVRLGARIHREGQSAIISGVEELRGACVMASDLRASAALVLAALAATGETVIRRIYHLDRGYDRLDKRLVDLGADIERVEDCPANVPESLRLARTVIAPSAIATNTSDREARQLRVDPAQPPAAGHAPAAKTRVDRRLP